MQVSFIIPLYNCLPLTQAMLASLRATLPAGLSHEIILVDDGSTDGTRAWLETLNSSSGGESLRADSAIRVILNDRNLGYAAANNRGAALARGEYLALLNNDLVLTAGWLEPMLALHRHFGKGAGLVGNLQRTVASAALDHAGISINFQGKPVHNRSLSPLRRLLAFAGASARIVPAVTGACMILKRDLWEQLGGFDEGFVNGCEDIDLCFRARAVGRVNVVALRSVIRHHVSSSPGRKLRDEANTRRLILRWRDALIPLGARAWCRQHVETYLRDPRDFPDRSDARQALFHALHLRRSAPIAAFAGVASNVEIELARWEKLLDGGALKMEAGCSHPVSVVADPLPSLRRESTWPVL